MLIFQGLSGFNLAFFFQSSNLLTQAAPELTEAEVAQICRLATGSLRFQGI